MEGIGQVTSLRVQGMCVRCVCLCVCVCVCCVVLHKSEEEEEEEEEDHDAGYAHLLCSVCRCGLCGIEGAPVRCFDHRLQRIHVNACATVCPQVCVGFNVCVCVCVPV